MQPKNSQSQMAISAQASVPGNLMSTHSLVGGKMTTSLSNVDNSSKNPLMLKHNLATDPTVDGGIATEPNSVGLPMLKGGTSASNGVVNQMALTGMSSFTH